MYRKKRLYLMLVLIVTTFILFVPRAHAFDLSEPDKKAHMGMSYDIAAAGYFELTKMGASKTTAALTSTALTLFVGAFKEFAMDRVADPNDLQADFVGTAAGIVFPFRMEF